jgi:predicted ATP-dependent serine protease
MSWFVHNNSVSPGCVDMLSGESGHGKSTVALTMADAIAKGRDFVGRKCSQHPVLILDREKRIDAMQERYERLAMADESGLIVWGGWLERYAPQPAASIVLEWVQRTEPKLVIVESL